MVGSVDAEDASEPRFVPDKEGFVEVVSVVENSVASARQVVPGIQGETHIEIVSGLADGDEIVTGTTAQSVATSRTTPRSRPAAGLPRRRRAEAMGLDARTVEKTYDMNSVGVRALRGRVFRSRPQRVRRHHGPVGLRQVHPDEHHRVPRRADLGELPARRRRRGHPSARTTGRDPQSRRSVSFSRPSICCPRSDVFHNVELPLIYAGMRPAERRSGATEAIDSVGLADRMSHRPTNFPADRGSAWRSPGAGQPAVDPPRRRTNRQSGHHDRREIMAIFDSPPRRRQHHPARDPRGRHRATRASRRSDCATG